MNVAVYILYEAYKRFSNPPEVLGGWMMVVAIVGLLVNLVGMFILMRGAGESLNVKGAYLEVLGDTLGSVGVIVAAIILLLTGWELADPIIGVGIGLFIIPRAYTLLRETVNVLLEGTPAGIDIEAIRTALAALPEVTQVHDLHAWGITSGMHAMSGHLVVSDVTRSEDILTAARDLLHDRFEIEHALSLPPPVLQGGIPIAPGLPLAYLHGTPLGLPWHCDAGHVAVIGPTRSRKGRSKRWCAADELRKTRLPIEQRNVAR